MTTLYQARDPAAKFRAVQRAKVSVGGKVIPAAVIAREVQNHEAATPQEAWRAAARALVVREMLLQEAHRVRLAPAPASDDEGRRETEEEALIRGVVEHAVATPQPDAAACHRYYDRNIQRFRSADLYEAAHILLPASADDEAARTAARALAKGLHAILAGNPGAFAGLAAQHSACPSAATGGNLGQVKPGDTVAEFDTALAAMQPGELSAEPVESRYGLHIIRLDRRIEGRVLPFDLVQERIATYLHERSTRQATAQFLALLAARTAIEGVDLPTPSEFGVM
jgi:peptidyl-prolyl cis-trans isomerase C